MQKDLGRVTGFKDHFSAQSYGYARYRPGYPAELFEFFNDVSSHHATAWDCATGSGQAAVSLAPFFKRVVASDASAAQIQAAIPHGKVDYRVAPAEQSGLDDHSVDLLTVGQAFHWFNQDAFLAEASRVLKPGGVLAVWCYETCHAGADCDAVVDRLYTDIVGDYWPPERVMIEQGYDGIALPGTEISVPAMQMSAQWRAEHMLGYLRTWSACKRFETAMGRDPVDAVEADLHDAWGRQERRVSWPLKLKVRRVNFLRE